VARGSNNDNDNNNQSNNQQQQQQQQQQRRRRRRRSKNNNSNNNNNKLVGRRVTVPNNRTNSSNSRRFSTLLPTTNTTTPATITEEEKNKYIAMDCEMVGIGPYGATSRLARVALVSYDGSVLYDVHVQVTEVITDYRTHVSGILPSDLLPSNGAVSFTQARSTVLSLIHNKILIGHGLKSDFAVLYIHDHPWYNIRDTAKYEPFMRQLKQHPQQHQQQPDNEYQCGVDDNMMTPSLVVLVPKKLKTLAYDKLGIVIQHEGMAHSPIEDAIAAMELYKRHCNKWERVIQYKLDRTKEIMDDY
jgi:RNA exonuclease 4